MAGPPHLRRHRHLCEHTFRKKCNVSLPISWHGSQDAGIRAPMTHVSASLAAHMQQALQRYRSKLSVEGVLRGLSADERHAVLVDLLAAYDEEASGATSAPTVKTALVAAPKAGSERAPVAKTGSAPQLANATPATGTSVADRLLAVLQAQPEAPIEQLTQMLYGSSDTAARNRLSTVLAQLRRRGKVQMVRRGKWRAVEPKPAVKSSRATKKVVVAAKQPSKRAQPSTSREQPVKTPSVAKRVRALLLSHPTGLTTRQIRELLGPDDAAKLVSTVVTKMRIRGVLVATGDKGSSVYTLRDGSSEDGE